MPLTYVEIEQQKNTRIWIFFVVVVLFYLTVALILANIVKFFLFGPSLLSGWQMFNVLLFALFAGLAHFAYSVSHSMSFIQKNVGVENLDKRDRYHERFRNILDEVNVATGSKYKITPVVIPTVATNAFAISGRGSKAVVGVTEGLLSKLNRQQLQAVVAHEVAHVASGDSFQTTIGCSLFGIYAAMLRGIKGIFRGRGRGVGGRGAGRLLLVLLAVYIVLSAMQFFYTVIRMFVSRDREYRADAIAVRLTRDPISLSEALYSISQGWRGLGYIDSSLESLFIMNTARSAADEKEGFWAGFMSTHPPIDKRIEILAKMAHSSVRNIQEKVVSQEKLKESMKEIHPEKKKPRWLLMDQNGEWQGPFGIAQLLMVGRISPASRIKALENDAIKQAKDEPLLKPLFDKRIAGLRTAGIDCPKCGQGLIDEEYEGAVVRRCVFCDGVFVEGGVMPRLVVRKEKGASERVKKMAELTQENGKERLRKKIREKPASLYKCPTCSRTMLRSFYTMTYLVEVDRCQSCGGIWFDRDELEMIQYLIEHKKT